MENNTNSNPNYNHRVKLNWNKPEDYEKVNRALNNYTRVYPKHYHLIAHNAPIKYFNHDNGNLIDKVLFIKYASDPVNGDKVSVRLAYKNGNKNYIWELSPSKMTIFICDMKERQKISTQKRNLYKLYKANRLKLLDEETEEIDDYDSLYII